ncbi:hypothetical protein AAKU67_002893 [Oxalobacteraceae bacterium GrIS 2.11]
MQARIESELLPSAKDTVLDNEPVKMIVAKNADCRYVALKPEYVLCQGMKLDYVLLQQGFSILLKAVHENGEYFWKVQ